MSRPNPEIVSNTVDWYLDYYGSVTTGYDSYNSLERTYTSTNTPGFPANLEWHPHTMYRTTYAPDPSWYYIDDRTAYGGGRYESRGGTYRFTEGFGRYHNGDIDELLARATGKVIDEVKNEAFNLANDIGEYRQTVDMFRTNARRLASAFRALRRGDIRSVGRNIQLRLSHRSALVRKGPKDFARNAGSYWLEMQYGWLPLVSDVYDAVEHLDNSIDGQVLRKKASRTSRSGYSEERTGAGITMYNEASSTKNRARIILEYRVDRRALVSLNDWGVTNPLDLAWELMPYSFVVDWFLPVGNYLSRLDAFLGVTFVRGTQSTLRDSYLKRSYYAKEPPVGYDFQWSVGGEDSWHYTDYVRTMLSAFPSVPLPRLKNPVSPKHIANAISLLAQAFLR